MGRPWMVSPKGEALHMSSVEQAPGSRKSGAGHPRGDGEQGTTVVVLDREELTEAINSTLVAAGCTFERLRAEALSGEFSSEANSRTWFCIAPFVE